MGSGAFIRRFTDEPGDSVLLNIESINVIDKDPPPQVQGANFGRTIVVGEFEDGPFNKALRATSNDLARTWGCAQLGYSYQGSIGQNPSARTRTADALPAELWNGNAFVALTGRAFGELVVCRADTSVGSVSFTRVPYLTGGLGPFFTLATGQTLVFDDGDGNTTATFTGTPATQTAAGAVYPIAFAGGETLTFQYDSQPNFTVTFQATDSTEADVINRVNAAAGFAFADNNAGQVRVTARIGGTAGSVTVVSHTGAAAAAIGFTDGTTTNGAGNVANIASVTVAEANAIVSAADPDAKVEATDAGPIRLSATAATTLILQNSSTANAFGFPKGVTSNSATGNDGTIPAGTRVSNGASKHYVTMQSVAVAKGSAGPYSVKVRHATDDGTGVSAAGSTVTTVEHPVAVDAYVVTNPVGLSAALTEAQVDAQYDLAIDATLDISSDAKKANFICSARQSNAVRRKLRTNAILASANGLFGRQAMIRPPLNTAKSVATGALAEPGVALYRDERTVYCYPGGSKFVSNVATVGANGGTGFSADGIVDCGADVLLASILSQLPAGENPAQATSFLGDIVGLERGANVQGFQMGDYVDFKASGICALRVDDGEAVFQSGVNSLDPASFPGKVDVERRTLADFIEDTLAAFYKPYSKKKMTLPRRLAILTGTQQFMTSLQGDQDGAGARVDQFAVFPAPDPGGVLRKAGRFRVNLKAVQTPSFRSIELAVTIGANVVIEEGV